MNIGIRIHTYIHTMKAPVPFSPQNLKYVSSLYRRALRTAHDWINRNDFYREKAAEIKLRFEQNRDIADPKELQVSER